MISRRNKLARPLVALLIFALLPLYMLASLITRNTEAQNAPLSVLPMVGRLEVHGGKHIRVDGNEAESGYTILDGQTLETSDCASATVHLLPVMLSSTANEIGTVEVATKTKGVINYSAGKVNMNLVRGCARVLISREIAATITLPDGTVAQAMQTYTPDRKRAESCFPVDERRDYRPNCVAPIIWAAVGGATAVVGTLAAVLPCSRGQDTSPNTPTAECR
ncbi:MAG TPA: hypothetical protein VGW36_00565 [Pyrinomonadaceae bacterium]|nr:hypothetical protein [Pyrinomonadaceae bacterium]